MSNPIQERFFYHSFPRRGVFTNVEIEKGNSILAAICDFGLLLTPELIEWRQPTLGTPRVFQVLQKRVCFTELSPCELRGHAERFGHFALEFEVDTVRQLSAMPVFYVPQPISELVDGSGIGTSLLAMAMDLHVVIKRIALLDKMLPISEPVLDFNVSFARSPDNQGHYKIYRDEAKNVIAAIGHAVTPWNDLSAGAYSLLNFFYPTDNQKTEKKLDYYRQREWRIACSFHLRNKIGSDVEVFHIPTSAERKKFLEIDQEFFSRKISTDTGIVETLDQTLVHPGLNNKRLIEMVRRVIVPVEAVKDATSILNVLKNPPTVISITEL